MAASSVRAVTSSSAQLPPVMALPSSGFSFSGSGSDAACEAAMKQIEEKDYIARLRQDGMRNFIRYGIACFKKDCRVVVDQNSEM